MILFLRSFPKPFQRQRCSPSLACNSSYSLQSAIAVKVGATCESYSHNYRSSYSYQSALTLLTKQNLKRQRPQQQQQQFSSVHDCETNIHGQHECNSYWFCSRNHVHHNYHQHHLNRFSSSGHDNDFLFLQYRFMSSSSSSNHIFNGSIPTKRKRNRKNDDDNNNKINHDINTQNIYFENDEKKTMNSQNELQQLTNACDDVSNSSPNRSRHHQQKNRNRLDVAIVGAPNAGKSQLLNVLTQSKVAAVSKKRHTTREGIIGVRTIRFPDSSVNDKNNEQLNQSNNDAHKNLLKNDHERDITTDTDTQIIFKDTPGFLRIEHAKEERLDRDLIVSAASEIDTVDYTLVVVDAARTLTDTYRSALQSLMRYSLQSQGRDEELDDDEYDNDYGDTFEDDDRNDNKEDNVLADTARTRLIEHDSMKKTPKFAIVLNKVDLVNPKEKLLDLAMELGSLAEQECLAYYSAPPSKIDDNEYNDDEKSNENIILNKDGDDRYDKLSSKELALLVEVSPIVFYVSALEEDGTDDLLDHLVKMATPSQSWLIPDDDDNDNNGQENFTGSGGLWTIEEQVCEIIREKLYRCLHQELPHSIDQMTRQFQYIKLPPIKRTSTSSHSSSQNDTMNEKNKNLGLVIHHDLIVYSKSHRRLVLGVGGGGGRTLQRIHDTALIDIQKLVKCPVALRLHVKLESSKNRSRRRR